MLSFISRQIMKKRFNTFSYAQKNLNKSQERAFKFLKANNVTPIKAKSYKEFVKESPEQKYDDVAIFNEMKERPLDFGVHYFALTSGSTGPSKKIPFNQGVGKVFKRSQFTSCALLNKKTGLNPIFTDSVVWGCPQDLEPKIHGIDCGSGSGYLGRSPSKLLQQNRFPSVETQNIINFETKVEALLRECGDRDVKAIGAIPTYFEFLMQTIFRLKNINSLVEIWPNMEVFLFSGTSITQHKDRIFEMVGKELATMGVYFCSECPIGFEAHTLDSQLPGYLLNVEDVVFGFAFDNGTIATFDELKEGDDVRILVSMPNGFQNYLQRLELVF